MKFVKQILRPGTYRAKTPTGERRTEKFTAERLKAFADTHKKMRDKGLKIPAPWFHNGAGPSNKVGRSSKDNAGFWDRFWVEQDGTLYGEIDVPREEDASKIGTTVQEVSIFSRPEWEDGDGEVWKDAILHAALVTRPIAARQENFKPVADELAIAMSDFVMANDFEPPKKKKPPFDPKAAKGGNDEGGDGSDDEESDDEEGSDNEATNSFGKGGNAAEGEPKQPEIPDASGASVADALVCLAQVGLKLPDDTSVQNLIERIIVAAGAIAAAGDDGTGDPNEMPPNGKERPLPIVMSQEGIEMSAEHLLAYASKQASKEYRDRIQAAIANGQCTPHFAKTKLLPMLEGFALSFDDETGDPVKTNLDVALEALEHLPQNMLTKVRTTGKQATRRSEFSMSAAEEVDLPPEYEGDPTDLTDEQIDKVVDSQLASIGR